MHYRVAFVGDGELPDAQDWAMIRVGGVVVFAVKESRVTPCVLEQAWQAYRCLAACRPELRAAV